MSLARGSCDLARPVLELWLEQGLRVGSVASGPWGQHPVTCIQGAGVNAACVPQPLPNSTNLQKMEINQSLLYRGPVDPANWFGVRKGFPNLGYIQVRAGPRGQAGAGSR